MSATIIQDIVTVNDKQFAFAKFDSFDVIINKTDTFINGTKMCNESKRFRDWLSNKSTKELIESYKLLYADKLAGKDVKYELTREDFKNIPKKISDKLQGTYIHIDLAIHLAQWISPVYALHVSRIVRDFYQSKSILELSLISDELKSSTLELEEALEKLSIKDSKIDTLQETVQRKNDKIVSLKERFSPSLANKNKEASFILIRKNIDYEQQEIIKSASYYDDGITIKTRDIIVIGYLYYIMRIQKLNRKSTIDKLNTRYEDMVILDEWIESSNAINIGNKMKEHFKDHEDFDFKYNHIHIGDLTEEEIIEGLYEIFDQDEIVNSSDSE